MSLLTLPAFLTRRREDTAMAATDETTVMRFATQGGAEVHVLDGSHSYPVRCLGCDYTHNNWSSIVYARSDANEHATDCRSMPKPEA